ncbi:metallophosphoesterase [Psychrobacillus sp. INOP01]|uniref:metallophosphoesterase n=1 Tax=Psychrobacillus sp. INOP01 TaxID=2829187 RepID=UPI001BAD5827|nr:metallophosphoesterase [Psychrobacillus sp. INOP01]QUG39948.1 metallophosphoesterase [Psychrobacillus sp. INOP01]
MKKFLMFVIAVIVLLYISNSWIQTTEITVESDRVPASFDGVKILQISDLHDATFGDNQEKLVKKIKNTDPDLIFITGDLIDSNRYNLDQSLELVRQIMDLAPIYYVTGNHEIATNDTENIKNSLTELGVNVLSNEEQIIEHNGEQIRIIGIEDPLNGILVNEALSQFEDNDLFTLVLSHRPETFQDYVDYEMDVVFSGHAHGGQFRLPGLGGLVAPGQGLFPSYTAGMYTENTTHMIVSRGLGNSVIPVRVFNSPEIVLVTLKSL